MVDPADAFIALKGGIGTLDELFETSTGLHPGDHPKPVGLPDVAGYQDSLETSACKKRMFVPDGVTHALPHRAAQLRS